MKDLLDILCCPECKRDLRLDCRIVTPSGRNKSGVLFCTHCNDIAGALRNFKYDFRHFDRAGCAERPRKPVVLERDVSDTVIPFDDPRLVARGSWEHWDGKYRLSHGLPGDELSFAGEFLDVAVRLLKHPWSGFVRLIVDGKVVGEVDLYNPKWSVVHWFPLANDLPPGRHTVKIVPAGRKNPASSGCQVLFTEAVVTGYRDGVARGPEPVEVNRVLPIPPEVIELMKQAPRDGLILDCGGGDRVLADPRYVNVEYQQCQLPTVFGDAMKLPFKTGVFDLVFSQALLEHVPSPLAAVEEMGRVARPGGILWSGMAFMQPVHAVPSHYFNATTWGIEELFKSLEILGVSWFGELSFTIDWLFKEAGIAEQMERGEYDALLSRIKALDPLVSHAALRAVASGVAVHARKPAETR